METKELKNKKKTENKTNVGNHHSHSHNIGGNLPTRNEYHFIRKLWHLIGGTLVCYLYVFQDISRTNGILLLGTIFSFFFVMEFGRKQSDDFNRIVIKLWGPFLRQHEVSQLSGTFWYILGMFLSVAFFPKLIAVLSIMFLSAGDPIASTFGILSKSITSTRVPWNLSKNLIGTFIASIICGEIAFYIFRNYTSINGNIAIPVAFLCGFIGGISEITSPYPFSVDDNFVIPILSGFLMWPVFIFLNLQYRSIL